MANNCCSFYRHAARCAMCGTPQAEAAEYLARADAFFADLSQRSNENCTNPYFAECLPLCGTAAKEAHEH